MARSRNIKPGFFTNELLGTADPFVALTFAGLWCLADKDGILEDRPLRIKAELFPYRENLDVNGYLTELERLRFILRYQAGHVGYIKVLEFHKHQSPHNTEKPRGFPQPEACKTLIQKGNCSITVKQPLDNGEATEAERSDSLIPDSLIPETPNGAGVRQAGTPNCPYDEIVGLYHEIMVPPCARVAALSDTRKGSIRARWRNELPVLDDWRNYFERVRSSPFLTGKVNGRNGQRSFIAGFDFLLRPATLIKVAEGFYDGGSNESAVRNYR